MKLTLLSSVDGGPMERLVEHLRGRGGAAELVSEMSASRWRQLASAGRLGRVRARLKAMLGFPARAVACALDPARGALVPTTNPFFVPALLVATKAIHGRPVVPLVYDLYPDAVEASGHARLSPLAVAIGQALNQFLFAHADGVVFIGERMAAHAVKRYGAPRAQAVIHTGASAGEFADLDKDAIDSVCGVDVRRKTVVSYVGNLGHVHEWETLRDGLAKLCRAEPGALVVIISASGPGAEFLRRELPADQRLIHFVAPTDDVEWRRLLARTDIALVTLRTAAVHTSVPSKAFSAMAAGSAIVAIAPRGSDLADIVAAADCGVVVAPGNSLHFLDALLRLERDRSELARLGGNAVRAVAKNYDLRLLAERWQAFVDEVTLQNRPGVGYEATKRLLDLTASGALLVALAPVLASAALAVRLSMGSPVFFRQRRPGRGGVPFELVKFRSMRAAAPHEVGPEHDAARLTRVGRFLRASSIDELPALLNVFGGELSLVGPRPLLVRYLSRYTARQSRRHEVMPGITGQAQVSGRNAISWNEKFEHDVWYVDNRSLWVDLKILVKTISGVLSRADISSGGHATMPEFSGSGVADAK